jgi:uncharacterized DUF497 family protein
MRFKWDQNKSKILNSDHRRGLSFEKVTQLFQQPYFLDQKNDDPEQFRAIGFVDEKMITLIFEQREDKAGEFYHFVTYWPSTKTERKLYEEG